MKNILLLLIINAIGQNTVVLTFTADNNAAYVQLDSIKIMNRTQGGDTIVYWPDTTLSLEINPGDLLLYVGYATFFPVGFSEESEKNSSFKIHQNFPNPIEDRSEISMYIPATGDVHVLITDLQGKVVYRADRQLDEGYHSFRFYPGGGSVYVFTAKWNGVSRSIQMISIGRQYGRSCRLDYLGVQSGEHALRNSLQVSDFMVRQSGILDYAPESKTCTFKFATNIPCPGMPTVEYEEKVYNTIQIFSQCWLKENLNVGVMISGGLNPSNNSIIEKYCYNNKPDSCSKYGGLYQWDEMMQYTTQQGAQGICPSGWHIPTDEEWKVLAGAVDSQYGIGDPEWDFLGWLEDYYGFDAGTNLKTTSGWNSNGHGTDLFDYSALPGGDRSINGSFYDVGEATLWWSSNDDNSSFAWNRFLSYIYPGVGRDPYPWKNAGFSVRCVRDY